MTLSRGMVRNAQTTPLDVRLADMAKVVCNAGGAPRAGVLGGANPSSLVTATGTMSVAIAAAEFVLTKGRADGVTIIANDGTVNVSIDAAPASGSRIDVIYVKHNDDTTGDANALPIFGVLKGAAAASPVKPGPLPTGALELATLRVYAGTSATNGGTNALTNTYQMTAARGGAVPFRTEAEARAWTNPVVGQVVTITSAARPTELTYAGSAWIATKGDTGWMPIDNFGGNASPDTPIPAWRVRDGVVYGKGRVNCAANIFDGWGITTLPASLRPAESKVFVVAGGSAASPMRFFVSKDGGVSANAPQTGASNYITLDNISWPLG